MTLIRVCAWCGEPLGAKPSVEDGTTHGMCDACFEAKMAELDDLPTPDETDEHYDWLLYEDRIALPEPEPVDED